MTSLSKKTSSFWVKTLNKTCSFFFLYYFQGDRTKNIGVVDSEFIVHRGVQTLGGSTITKDGTRGKNAQLLRQKAAQAQKNKREASRS